MFQNPLIMEATLNHRHINRLATVLILVCLLLSATGCGDPKNYVSVSFSPAAGTSVNQPVTVMVSVMGRGVGGTGTVTVDGDENRCVIHLVNGSGNCQIAFRTPGQKTISVNYSGDSEYSTEYSQHLYSIVSPLTPTPSTPTELTLQINPADIASPGQAVDLHAHVESTNRWTNAPIPAGSVVFTIPGIDGCTAPLSNGEGHCTVVFPSVGDWRITAEYPGGGAWGPSTLSVDYITRYETQTTLSLSTVSPVVGQTVYLTATVMTLYGGPTARGTVNFIFSQGITHNCDELTLLNGTVTCGVVFPTAGQWTISVSYWHDESAEGQMLSGSIVSQTITVRNALAPAMVPTESSGGDGGGGDGGGGGSGCIVPDGSGGFYCQIPCSNPEEYPESCP